ncbi:VOC family protein [Paracraurococcus lichenis]|uniref:VOC family protein n=1 Tax=Paracraurococcus lichenis TaxID=3064888 RepID=A0ABT9E0I3_9PROT|nr:VOC family protein [Paracraurococcus sp. LOR1-02]MDO9709676.1 VOC family protein [Paracraurococcus sp. LOR1-02]
MSPGPLARVELACRDPHRQREFFGRILGLAPAEPGQALRYRLGGVELVLRARGDALFPSARAPEAGTLLAFPVEDAELERWHRRMLTARVAVLDAPGPSGAPPRVLRVADPEGNVIELYAAA